VPFVEKALETAAYSVADRPDDPFARAIRLRIVSRTEFELGAGGRPGRGAEHRFSEGRSSVEPLLHGLSGHSPVQLPARMDLPYEISLVSLPVPRFLTRFLAESSCALAL
jgi:hypothetical protein